MRFRKREFLWMGITLALAWTWADKDTHRDELVVEEAAERALPLSHPLGWTATVEHGGRVHYYFPASQK